MWRNNIYGNFGVNESPLFQILLGGEIRRKRRFWEYACLFQVVQKCIREVQRNMSQVVVQLKYNFAKSETKPPKEEWRLERGAIIQTPIEDKQLQQTEVQLVAHRWSRRDATLICSLFKLFKVKSIYTETEILCGEVTGNVVYSRQNNTPQKTVQWVVQFITGLCTYTSRTFDVGLRQ